MYHEIGCSELQEKLVWFQFDDSSEMMKKTNRYFKKDINQISQECGTIGKTFYHATHFFDSAPWNELLMK